MKAFLLSAGYGSRLKPITDYLPKCLVTIGDIPMLRYWIELFRKNGITEVLINTSYLSDVVLNFIDSFNANNSDIKLICSHEPVLLGSAGTILANKDFIGSDDNFNLLCRCFNQY